MGSISTVSKNNVLKALETARSLAQEYVASETGTAEDRYELSTAAMELTDACGTVADKGVRMVLEGPCASSALRVAYEGGWTNVLLEKEVVTADEIVERCGGEKNVVVRIMRVLTASRIAKEVDYQRYSATDFMKFMLQPGMVDIFAHGHDSVYATLTKLPLYLSNTSFKEPVDPSVGPACFAHGKPLWKIFADEPAKNERFNRGMMVSHQARGLPSESFPFDEKTSKLDLKPDDVFLVDVGGGMGHQTRLIKEKFPQIKGRAIVQDLPHVIKQASAQKELVDAGIEFQGHDMFTPEPVVGAAFYHFAAVFHDWADGPSLEILKNVRGAMKPGYSKLLIFDWVLPDVKATLRDASQDLWMMVECCGKERTKSEWENLLSQAGMRTVEIHKKGVGAMIEIELTQ